MASKTPAETLRRVFQILTSEFDRDLPITVPLAFIHVAASGDDGVDQGELQDVMKASSPTMSRTVARIGVGPYLLNGVEQEGMGLIEAIPEIRDRRRKTLKLTPKGHKVLDRMATELKR